MKPDWIIKPDFGMFGWTSPVQISGKGTSRITINKLVSTGLSLRAGQKLYCYAARSEEGRPVMVTFLDGKPREENHDGS